MTADSCAVRKVRFTVWALLLTSVSPLAWAGGPRFVTGTAFAGAAAGQVMSFYTPTPLYYTDPGELNASVTHAQADAMVAAAAGVWNVTTSSLTLAQGGTLAEHVSDANSYFSGTGVVFPADLLPSNYLAKPIAVVYDTDGSVTDLLLGSGASDPSACRHNAVTESVDGFGQTGTIEHAVIVLNGRCVGSAPEQLLQMQYQLERVFGRVVGLTWAQVNDNVFTGVSPVTVGQETNWPIMHPIDVICGPYTYQCMQSPFTLRPDDISTLAWLYPVTTANAATGKVVSTTNGLTMQNYLYFPTGQGMESVNMAVQWGLAAFYLDSYQTVAGVSGFGYQRNIGNPVTGRTEAAADNQGGYIEYESIVGRLPLNFSSGRINVLNVVPENINPLYSGEYAIGIYEGTPTAMSGTVATGGGYITQGTTYWALGMVAVTPASTCSPGNDGVETAPVAADPSGWWTGLICSRAHVSWWSATVKAGRTWTFEATAIDETGTPTERKLRPVIGVWKSTDATGGLPTVAATPSAMNATSIGTTQLSVAAATQTTKMRIAIADLLGFGRPDFGYKARILYADSLAPSIVGSGGGQITITGTGFRTGNQVTVNGVPGTVVSWSSTSIVADVPTMAAAGMTVGSLADVAVIDPSTGGSTVMSGVLSYSSAPDLIKLVSAPAAIETGVIAPINFAARVYASDGLAPVPGASVEFAVSGNALLGVCGDATSCAVSTDATGLATTNVSGTAVGSAVLTATETSGGATLSVTEQDTDPVRAVTAVALSHYLASGEAVSWNVSVAATQDGAPAVGAPVSWSVTGGVSLAALQSSTDITGKASVAVQTNGMDGGTQAVVTGCAWTKFCASTTAYGVAPPLWAVAVSSGAGQSVKSTAKLGPVTLLVTDGAGHPLQGAPVKTYQTVDAWEGPCQVQGPCPAAPVLASGTTTAASDANGLVTVMPLQVPGVPQVVNLAASTGTQGFVTLTLTVNP